MWKRQMWVAYLFILPAILIISIFVMIPSVVSIYFSFFKYDAITPAKFIGLRNYGEFFFEDPLALRSLSINLYYIIGTLPVAILVGFIIAIALNARWFRGRQFFNAAYFIPVAISMVGGAAICLWLLDPMGGLVNWFMQLIGLSPQAWVGDPKLALFTICLVSIWKNLGFFMVILVLLSCYCVLQAFWFFVCSTPRKLVITSLLYLFSFLDKRYKLTLIT